MPLWLIVVLIVIAVLFVIFWLIPALAHGAVIGSAAAVPLLLTGRRRNHRER